MLPEFARFVSPFGKFYDYTLDRTYNTRDVATA